MGLDSLSVNIIYLKRLIATIMALYATDADGYIFAADASPGASYRCLECFSPVKVRRGRNRLAHFYHLQRSPQCHLYSKSEDHLLVQLQLQKILSEESAQIERPFLTVHRIADLLWEKEKIAFEIQCSSLDISEAERRVIDYNKLGYTVVWLLDDRIFNQRFVRNSEEFLRTQTCYFFSFQRAGISRFYDQIEIIIQRKRFKKSYPLTVDLSTPRIKPFLEWPPDIPDQIKDRIHRAERYFRGDLIHKTIQAAIHPYTALYLEKWRNIELELHRLNRPSGRISTFFQELIVLPYDQLLNWLIRRMDQH